MPNELDMDAYHNEGIDPGEHKVFSINPSIHSFNQRFEGISTPQFDPSSMNVKNIQDMPEGFWKTETPKQYPNWSDLISKTQPDVLMENMSTGAPSMGRGGFTPIQGEGDTLGDQFKDIIQKVADTGDKDIQRIKIMPGLLSPAKQSPGAGVPGKLTPNEQTIMNRYMADIPFYTKMDQGVRGGRREKISDEKWKAIDKDLQTSMSSEEIAKKHGVGTSTVYNRWFSQFSEGGPIESERSLKLVLNNKYLDPDTKANTSSYRIMQGDEHISDLTVTPMNEDKYLHVDWMGKSGSWNPNPKDIWNLGGKGLDLIPQILKDFPKAEAIGGVRVPNVRSKSKVRLQNVDLNKLKELSDWYKNFSEGGPVEPERPGLMKPEDFNTASNITRLPANQNIKGKQDRAGNITDAPHPLDFLLNWLEPKKNAYAEAVAKQQSKKQKTVKDFVAADRNKYPITYKVKDEDVANQLEEHESTLKAWKDSWDMQGYSPEMFNLEFASTIKRRDELKERRDDIIKQNTSKLSPELQDLLKGLPGWPKDEE